MSSQRQHLFFLGKGGVGKSTTAALSALKFAAKGKKVLLVSLDPAHNQSDIFEHTFSEKPLQVAEGLQVIESDMMFWVKKYLRDVQSQISRSYNYLTALNLEKYLDVIKYSPGIEEYALLLAFNEICVHYSDNDYILFDMPPTAMALKFFGLPKLSLTWLKKLLELREEILKKREIITKIKLGKKEFERDKILNRLNVQIQQYSDTMKLLQDREKTKFYLVMNPDKLSLNESRLIIQYLNDLKFTISAIVLNKVTPLDDTGPAKSLSENIPVQIQMLADRPLIGIDALQRFLEADEK